jgi:hypothetical protein
MARQIEMRHVMCPTNRLPSPTPQLLQLPPPMLFVRQTIQCLALVHAASRLTLSWSRHKSQTLSTRPDSDKPW